MHLFEKYLTGTTFTDAFCSLLAVTAPSNVSCNCQHMRDSKISPPTIPLK